MNWQPQPGTEAITSWINQGALFALVLAVAAVVACAATWAVGSLAANGAVVSRARTVLMLPVHRSDRSRNSHAPGTSGASEMA